MWGFVLKVFPIPQYNTEPKIWKSLKWWWICYKFNQYETISMNKLWRSSVCCYLIQSWNSFGGGLRNKSYSNCIQESYNWSQNLACLPRNRTIPGSLPTDVQSWLYALLCYNTQVNRVYRLFIFVPSLLSYFLLLTPVTFFEQSKTMK